MTDSFIAYVRVGGLTNPFDPWRVAGELEQVMEAALWNVWSDSIREYMATTPNNIQFSAADLIALKERFRQHGGDLYEIAIHASKYGEPDLSIWTNITPKYPDNAVDFYVNGSNRVDVDAACNALETGLAKLRRRKVWGNSRVTREPTYVSTTADGRTNKATAPMLKTRGLVSHVRRFMIRNRDEIIVSLVGGILVSIGVAVVTALWPR